MRRIAVSILALLVIAAVPGSIRPASAEEQPPALVGRVSTIAGQLGFHLKGETQWSAASVNYPVATGGSFWTDPKSRAEIRIGAQTIDLAGNTEIDVVKLDQQVMQIALPQGRIELHLRQLGGGNSAEIDIPRGGVWLLQPGLYDIKAGAADQPTRIMVFEGSARFVGGALDQGIKAGEAAVISGGDTLTATIERAAPDAFVQWCRARDYREQRLAAPYHISPGMTGYEELDSYGTWRTSADYGEVWYPRSVPAGWAPYRDGHWSWIEPWGWNWVDAAPWGFAPSHYGRWGYFDNAWGWVPGGFEEYPVYAPALVDFLDFGGLGGSYVGWFPLGPREAYWPGYTNDQGYIRAVNAGIVDGGRLGSRPSGEAATAFANHRAATVVPQQTFANAGHVGRAAMPLSGAMQNARVAAQAPALHPNGARAGTAAGPATAGAGAAASLAARSGARGGAQFAAPGHGSATGWAAAGSARGFQGNSAMGGARFGARGFAAQSARGSQFAGARYGHMGPSHFTAARFGGGPHFRGGGPHFGGGGPHFGGGGPHFAGGGPHFGGGGPHFAVGGGGGGPHLGGGGGGPHGGGGGAPGGGGGHGGGKGHG
jgi:hypothetical protein